MDCFTQIIDVEWEERPWGRFSVLEKQPFYKVKKIVIFPKKRFSLQYHNKRSETWVCVQGFGKVTIESPKGNYQTQYISNNIIIIPKGCIHRCENTGDIDLVFIEIQKGDCHEEDIIRLEDDFGR